MIVLDHHEPKSALPDCVAVVNPKAETGCAFHYLCSVGIVFKLCHALLKMRPSPGFDLKANLDLVALGTVADIVPLQAENRIFVQRGIAEIAKSKRPGLRKLIEVAAVRFPRSRRHCFPVGSAPECRRTACHGGEGAAAPGYPGRNGSDGISAVARFPEPRTAGVEKKIVSEAEEELAKSFDPDRDAAIVVGAREWHPGVLGIVASRLARKSHRPAVVVGFDSSGLGKGAVGALKAFRWWKRLVVARNGWKNLAGTKWRPV